MHEGFIKSLYILKKENSAIVLFLIKLANDYVNRLGKNEIVANDIDLVMNADTVDMMNFAFLFNDFRCRLFLKYFVRIQIQLILLIKSIHPYQQ